MTEDEVLHEFRTSEALLEGHFKLSSGRHSAYYLQCARVLMEPMRASRLAAGLAAKLPRELRSSVEKVVSPAMGGIIIGHEMGRALGKEAIFLERPEGTFEFRRGFDLKEGEKVLVVEDVVTTGLSSKEAMQAVGAAGGSVVGLASLVDRRAQGITFHVPYYALLEIAFPTYAEDELPPELAAIPVTKPGSRK
ncbi:orotate phosphoribosyltransferase [Pelagerythrobacter rhizovicinus]|uniref:Orotate phosphoribosyltransferase n=1 Tax=Pelagerythrobacter rhizovicinus TaxID=2268576 RepID=A0A4V1QWF6_9SPHN|nr:orotate phosphoribosyltransferase [Pelagerythrobacter rhizovicinus]RXZ65986.1 orotate phosphoribosyltransferase [Pelagerythrobacter rhizovicinus]